jgi:hypothetical protein
MGKFNILSNYHPKPNFYNLVKGTSNRDIAESKIKSRLRYQAIIFFVIWLSYIVLLIVNSANKSNWITTVFITSIIFLYFGSACSLIIISNYFLIILKKSRRTLYNQKGRIIRFYTLVIGISMIIRGVSEIFDFVYQIKIETNSRSERINNIVMIS